MIYMDLYLYTEDKVVVIVIILSLIKVTFHCPKLSVVCDKSATCGTSLPLRVAVAI